MGSKERSDIMKFLNHTSVKIWLITLIIFIYALGFKLNTSGVVVTYVSKNSSAYNQGIKPGYTILKINGVTATENLIKNFKNASAEVKTNHGTFYINVNDTMGIEVKPVRRTNLKFGLDIEGGTRAIIEPKDAVDQSTIQRMIATLNLRLNTYGLRETSIRPLYGEKNFIEVEMAGGSTKQMKDLLETQGKFDAKIPFTVKNGESFTFDTAHTVKIINKTVFVDNNEINNYTKIDGIPIKVRNITDNSVIFEAIAFTGEDIKQVYDDPQHSGIQAQSKGYRFQFGILISNEAAQKFAKITQNLNIIPNSNGEGYLNSKLELYLDNNLMDSLQIAAGMKGKAITTPSITGYGDTKEEASESMRKLQSILNSGSLPVGIKIVSMDEISPRLGSSFLKESAIAGIIGFIVISLIVSVRYRDAKTILPIVVFSFSEILITLGIAALIGQTIDLPAIGGLLAAIGTSVDDEIMIIDEVEEKKEELSFKQRIKRALSVIFGSAFTTIAAMVPLIFVGFGVLKGFAIISIIGILVSILISRPAFNDVVSDIMKR